MIFTFDTETTGLPLFNNRSEDAAQPHLVEIALITSDDAGNEIAAVSAIIRPDGWIIPAETTAIHGITQERAMDEGIPEALAVEWFIIAQARASVRVAHNESFDRRVLRIAMTRAGIARDMIEAIEARPSYCTCNQSKAIVNLPPTAKMVAKGMNGAKPPKLIESYKHFFGEDMIGAHNALADARGAARVYFHLQTLRNAA